MRLWHKDMLAVLPREQLVAQWRELSAIAGNILTKGTPNHILVNRVMDYDLDHFIAYATLVRDEMSRRKYRTMDSVWKKIISVKPDYQPVSYNDLFADWMNYTYWMICYYNLKEKWMCGGISSEDWYNIEKLDEVVSV